MNIMDKFYFIMEENGTLNYYRGEIAVGVWYNPYQTEAVDHLGMVYKIQKRDQKIDWSIPPLVWREQVFFSFTIREMYEVRERNFVYDPVGRKWYDKEGELNKFPVPSEFHNRGYVCVAQSPNEIFYRQTPDWGYDKNGKAFTTRYTYKPCWGYFENFALGPIPNDWAELVSLHPVREAKPDKAWWDKYIQENKWRCQNFSNLLGGYEVWFSGGDTINQAVKYCTNKQVYGYDKDGKFVYKWVRENRDKVLFRELIGGVPYHESILPEEEEEFCAGLMRHPEWDGKGIHPNLPKTMGEPISHWMLGR
jgi:hypothetical protein